MSAFFTRTDLCSACRCDCHVGEISALRAEKTDGTESLFGILFDRYSSDRIRFDKRVPRRFWPGQVYPPSRSKSDAISSRFFGCFETRPSLLITLNPHRPPALHCFTTDIFVTASFITRSLFDSLCGIERTHQDCIFAFHLLLSSRRAPLAKRNCFANSITVCLFHGQRLFSCGQRIEPVHDCSHLFIERIRVWWCARSVVLVLLQIRFRVLALT